MSLVFSENGIIAKAREAADKTNQAAINEQEEMNKVADYMSNMLNGIGEGSTPEEPEDPTANWDLGKVDKVTSADGVVVPVPIGYTASSVATENTVVDGFVIYEGEEEVNDTNKDTAQETRNQFVWVPVENPSEMYGTDSSGKKWGKLYDFSSDGITLNNWTEQDGVMSITNTTSSREPDIIITYDAVSTNLQQAGLSASATTDTFKTQLETEFNNMIISVEKYGGFYIGRYETGNLSQTEAAVIKNNTDINEQTWYTMYNKSKGVAANSNVTTTMIWGCQWDAVMRWMYNSGDNEKKKYTYDSIGKGNYGTISPIATGSNNNYAVNNIYDMAGNAYDWTIKASGTAFRIGCGGCYKYSASYNPASNSCRQRSCEQRAIQWQ